MSLRPAYFLPTQIATLLAVLALGPVILAEDEPDPSFLTIKRIYADREFDAKSFSGRWLENEAAFTTHEPSARYKGRMDIVRHDAQSGEASILVAAADLIPPGETTPLEIEDYGWSQNRSQLLVYTNSKRVWRKNTRGDYWVLDRGSQQLKKLGGDAPPHSLMFAKFSPNGTEVAYVRERNIYVENLVEQSIQNLTKSSSEDEIYGTSDWCYEEEFGVRDGFRWSPDGKRIAFWYVNTEGVGKFPLVNNTDSLYPEVFWFAYPKVGQHNPKCGIGVVDLTSRKTAWMSVPGDPREHYLPRMEWAKSSDVLLIQQLNRLQNRNQLYLANAADGSVIPFLTEEDAAWVEVNDELFWLNDGNSFTWISERDGWRHVYLANRNGGDLRLLTPGNFDVVELLHVDEERGLIEFTASPENATERYLYQASLSGGSVKRVTPAGENGVHHYRFSNDGQWAIHDSSAADTPPKTELVHLPNHAPVRSLNDNTKLIEKFGALKCSATEFFRVDIGSGVQLDGWCIKPPSFDPAKSYPLLVYVYGEPNTSTVMNEWGGSNYLWHQMLAQQGYVIMSFDNRGTNVPKGRDWRKCVYGRIGILSPLEQAAAVKSVLQQRPYIDPQRVGIWGWSGGGSSSLHAIFKYPDLYSTAISIAPVPNQRYYDTMYQERYMGDPDVNVDGYRDGSPINFASQLKGNLLLIHGTGDDNCHYQTTEMLIDELVAHNKQFSLMAYPNRTHSIKERENTTVHLRELMIRFLNERLPPTP